MAGAPRSLSFIEMTRETPFSTLFSTRKRFSLFEATALRAPSIAFERGSGGAFRDSQVQPAAPDSTVTTTNSGCSTKNGKATYALLPVWILNTKWKDKLYTFAMNGQTGKFIGNLPCDKGKFWRMLLIIAAAIAVPLALILTLLFM